MASIRRQRISKRTTERPITLKEPLTVRGSSHDPDTGELLHLTFKLPAVGAAGGPETWYIVTLSRADVERLATHLANSETSFGYKRRDK